MRILPVREREQVPITAPGGAGLTEVDASVLARLEPALPAGFLGWEHRAIRFGPYCGVLRVGELTLEVLPKIAGDSSEGRGARGVLVAMLRAAGELADPPAGSAPLGLQSLHLLDIFILDFCSRVSLLLHRGAIRAYETQEENLTAVRGRLHLPEHLRRNLFDPGRIYCRYDEFSADNVHNRVLKAVLGRLLVQALGAQAKRAVNGLLRRLEDISLRPCSASDISRLRFDRLTAPWRPIFDRAAEFMRGLYPDVSAGQSEGPCLLFNMERLFEVFVGARLRRQWCSADASGMQVVLQGPQRHFASARNEKPAFRMRPDITIVGDDDTVERIYDAKWKRLDAKAAYHGVSGDDIYQMASYAGRYGCGRLALLYPCSEGAVPGLVESFDIRCPGAPRIEVYTLDLLALTRGAALPEGLGPPPWSLPVPLAIAPLDRPTDLTSLALPQADGLSHPARS
jgi:5-methylcytosine-specific restriction enzyme subunit McrC